MGLASSPASVLEGSAATELVMVACVVVVEPSASVVVMAEVKVVGVALALPLLLPEALPLELPVGVAEALLSEPVMLSRAEVPPVEMSERMEEASVGMAPPDSVMEL